MNQDNWDPLPHERAFHRHSTTGDLGWLVRREGKDCIRLDRPAQEIVRPFRPDEWIVEREHRPLTKYQLAQVAFEADKKLCFFLGHHDLSRREWLALKDEPRIAFTNNGPGGKGPRQQLFNAIMSVLEIYASSK